MDDLSLPEVRRLVAAANAVRRQRDASGSAVGSDGLCAERQLNALFRTSHTLAVYGTLAPGQPNHHVVAPLGGEWTDGLIEGDLLPVGWGAALGYPGFRPRVGGAAVAVQVLTAPYWRLLGPPLTASRARSISASWCRYSAQSSAPGRRASGGCTQSPTSMLQPRPVPVRPRSNVSLQLTSGPWEQHLGRRILSVPLFDHGQCQLFVLSCWQNVLLHVSQTAHRLRSV